MASWKIQQRAEIWYEIYVEADTFEQALKASHSRDDDWQTDYEDVTFTDHFWGENIDTGEQFDSKIGAID